MMFGTPFGARLLVYGRLKVLWLATIFGILGTVGQLFINYYILLGGRILYGFASGVLAAAIPRYMDEILPPHLMGFFGGLYTFSFAVATILGYVLALGLPPDDDTAALKADGFWRVIFGLPIPFFILQDIMAVCFCRYEAPKFLIIQIDYMRKKRDAD